MIYDDRGVHCVTSSNLIDLLYQYPDLDLSRFNVYDADEYNQSVRQMFADMPLLRAYDFRPSNNNIEEFDDRCQSNWHMPDEYKALDIAAWVLAQCNTDAELQRCGEELLLYQERDAFDLLRYMKYLVDTMRAHGIVWGVGRGSSVASFVLYKIGIHKVNSMYYDLDPREFLK